jgi:ABC-type sugar transport system ATPase subunit
MAAITFSKLTKTYPNGFAAVRGIDLQIREREFMVLVGPSGCGKTTSLRMIAGLEDITAGEIAIAGRRVNEVAPKDRDIAMVFQSYALYPHMTVAENMAFALTLRRMPKVEIASRVAEAARMLALEAHLDKQPKELSGGQRQRVALGRAVVRQPRAFLFDEPLSNLDAKLRGEMRRELRTLHQRMAVTSVYVTHDQIEAMTLGDRITVMNAGAIQQVAEPMTVYDWPWNRFVAAFIGTPPMNFLSGQVTGEAGQEVFVVGGTKVPLAMPHRARLAEVAGREAVLGVRPELLTPAAPGPGILATTVVQAELMGDHQYVTASVGNGTLTVKTASRERFAPGAALHLAVVSERCHIFAAGGDDAPNLTLPPGFAQQQ